MDPHQRVLLMACFDTLTNAGHNRETLRRASCGIYLGFGATLWGSRVKHLTTFSAHGQVAAAAAGRVSYLLDLTGPSLCVDTGCSASLVAVDMACQGLKLAACNQALCAGVSLALGEVGWIATCLLRALAPDGKCKTFDSAAGEYMTVSFLHPY